MNHLTLEELAKWQCLQSLFAPWGDPDMTRHLKSAIEFALTGDEHGLAPVSVFTEAAMRLARDKMGERSFGLEHWPVVTSDLDPLWFHHRLVKILKKLSGLRESLLLITGLRQALCPDGHNWTQALQKRYQHLADHIVLTAKQYVHPKGRFTLIYR